MSPSDRAVPSDHPPLFRVARFSYTLAAPRFQLSGLSIGTAASRSGSRKRRKVAPQGGLFRVLKRNCHGMRKEEGLCSAPGRLFEVCKWCPQQRRRVGVSGQPTGRVGSAHYGSHGMELCTPTPISTCFCNCGDMSLVSASSWVAGNNPNLDRSRRLLVRPELGCDIIDGAELPNSARFCVWVWLCLVVCACVHVHAALQQVAIARPNDCIFQREHGRRWNLDIGTIEIGGAHRNTMAQQ